MTLKYTEVNGIFEGALEEMEEEVVAPSEGVMVVREAAPEE